VWPAILALHTSVPGNPNHKKIILLERNLTNILVPKLPWTIVLAQPGLIPQISGKLTGLQVNGATIFVDHHSDHVYVFLMWDLTLNETILAKHAYELFLSSIGVTLKAYHADNGQFADKGFHDDCITCNQVITFCGIGSHHQNGIAE
jgi:hypothetical protein